MTEAAPKNKPKLNIETDCKGFKSMTIAWWKLGNPRRSMPDFLKYVQKEFVIENPQFAADWEALHKKFATEEFVDGSIEMRREYHRWLVSVAKRLFETGNYIQDRETYYETIVHLAEPWEFVKDDAEIFLDEGPNKGKWEIDNYLRYHGLK